MTWSTLKIVPTDDDDKSIVSCVASNVYFPADSREQQITLNVHRTVLIIIWVKHNILFFFMFNQIRQD